MIKATTITSSPGHELPVIVRKNIMIEFCDTMIEKKTPLIFY
jgi:hypothetical protein